VCVYMCIYMCIYIYIYIYIYMCVCVCVCVYVYICIYLVESPCRFHLSASQRTVFRPTLAFTRYYYYQYYMVHSIRTRVRKGSRILCNHRAIVLHQGGQGRRAGRINRWLIRAQQPRRKTISCKGQASLWPTARKAPNSV